MKQRKHDDTILTHAGRDPHAHDGAVNMPVHHASTILAPDLDGYLDLKNREIYYGLYGTRGHLALAEAIAALEQAHGCVLLPSGFAAVTCAFLAYAQTGAHVLITDNTYAPTRAFADSMLRRFGVETSYFDPTIGAGIGDLVRPNTVLVWGETPGSLTFELHDVPAMGDAITAAANRLGIARPVFAIDNTYSGGYYAKPIVWGADISVQAATKYIVGHSDVMMGTVCCANAAVLGQIKASFKQLGFSVGPDDVYLAQRGLRTMGVRLPRHYASSLRLAAFLAEQPEVSRVFHPARADHPQHALWQRDFSGASGLFSFMMPDMPRDKLRVFVDDLQFFGMGYSWGGYESLLIPTREHHLRARAWPHDEQLLRMHVGLEDVEDLQEDLAAAFARIRAL